MSGKVSAAVGSRPWALIAVVAGLVAIGVALIAHQGEHTFASDFSCFWTGARVAGRDPARLYDFAYLTQLQGWPYGLSKLRPFISPPSSLLLFTPFSLGAFWTDYAAWTAVSAGLFLWAGRKAGAPLWFMLFPPVLFAAYCGQVTLIVGALVIGALVWLGPRPLIAGAMFGLAAALKPQLVVLVPIALMAEGRWRAFLSAGAVAGGLVAISALVWGVQPWFDWLAALPRQQSVIFNDIYMVRSVITPYAALQLAGLNGAWALLLAPIAPVVVWQVFRRTPDLADRSLALFVGAFVTSPYAMNYEAALLAPAVALYLARTQDRRWLRYAVAAILYTTPALGVVAPAAAAALPAIRRLGVAKPAVAVVA